MMLLLYGLLPTVAMLTVVTGGYVQRVTTRVRLSFEPKSLDLTRGERGTVTINATLSSVNEESLLRLHAYCSNTDVCDLLEPRSFIELNETLTFFNVTATGRQLGRTHVKFVLIEHPSINASTLWDSSNSARISKPKDLTHVTVVEGKLQTNFVHWQIPDEYDLEIVVRNPASRISMYLDAITILLVSINLIGIGGQINASEMFYLMKRPTVVGLSLLCRFGVIPALVLGLVELFRPSRNTGLALLSLTCSPAEGASAMLLILADADLTASAALLSVNNFASFAMIPLWTIAFENRLYSSAGHVTIPFLQIFFVFAYTVCTLLFGAILSRTQRNLYTSFWARLPVFTVCTLLANLVMDLYSNAFMWRFVSVSLFFVCATITFTGYAFGAVIAFVGRQPLGIILVMLIEMGTRTTYVTKHLLQRSLPQPEADVAKTGPVLISAMSLCSALLVVLIHRYARQARMRKYAQTDCSFLDSKDDISEPELLDNQETCI